MSLYRQSTATLRAISADELISNVFQVAAYDLWLRTNAQDIVARAFDQRGLPAGRHGAKGVSGKR
jgi:hypothetical protein